MKNRSRTQISWHPLHPLSIALSVALCQGNLTTVLRTRLCSIFLCQQQFIIIAVITIFIITIDEDYNMEHSWSASPSDNVAQTTSFRMEAVIHARWQLQPYLSSKCAQRLYCEGCATFNFNDYLPGCHLSKLSRNPKIYS